MTSFGLRLLLAIAALGFVAGCDDAPESPLGAATTASAAAPVEVTIARSRFETRELRIAPGTTVVFVNTDEFAHTVTSRDGAATAFDSGELLEGDAFELTFDQPGEYPYFCRIHPTMRAMVIVE